MSLATELERYIFEQVNREREAAGLHHLMLETKLNDSADAHSDWIIEADQFSHTGLDGSSPTQRIVAAGFDLEGSWRTGENIAVQSAGGALGYYDELDSLHQGLMDSPGHRANILNADFDYVGISVMVGRFEFSPGVERISVVITQNFAATDGTAWVEEKEGQNGTVKVVEYYANAPVSGDVTTVDSGTSNITEQTTTVEEPTLVTITFGTDAADDMAASTGRDVVYMGAGDDNFSSDGTESFGGRDKVFGEDGNDRLIGGNARDFLDGGAGNDVIRGGLGSDILRGGAGTDNISGGRGYDILTGGDDADSFVFTGRFDTDVITDFTVGEDRLRLDDALFGGTPTAASVLENHGSIVNGNAVIEMSSGDQIVLLDITNLSDLTDSIEFF